MKFKFVFKPFSIFCIASAISVLTWISFSGCKEESIKQTSNQPGFPYLEVTYFTNMIKGHSQTGTSVFFFDERTGNWVENPNEKWLVNYLDNKKDERETYRSSPRSATGYAFYYSLSVSDGASFKRAEITQYISGNAPLTVNFPALPSNACYTSGNTYILNALSTFWEADCTSVSANLVPGESSCSSTGSCTVEIQKFGDDNCACVPLTSKITAPTSGEVYLRTDANPWCCVVSYCW